MRKFLNGLVKRIDTLVAIAGILLIVAGVRMYSVPAALITGGALLLMDAYLPRQKDKK